MLKNLAMILGLAVGLSACLDPYEGYHRSDSNGYGYHGPGSSSSGSGYNGFGYNGYGYHGPGYNGYGY